jgi:nucleotide-binding universal stress UspA family protein
MYNTILVPLDRSKRAEAILQHVENLALKYKAKVIFMKVIDVPPLEIGYSRKSLEQYRKDLDVQEKRDGEYLADMQRVFMEKGIDTATHLTQGPVVEEIIATAERESADLIAIASHGRGGLSRSFYGSVSAALLQRVDRPLLLIRSRNIQSQ